MVIPKAFMIRRVYICSVDFVSTNPLNHIITSATSEIWRHITKDYSVPANATSWSVLQWGEKIFWINAFFYQEPFNPDHQTMGGTMNPNFGASSFSCSANGNQACWQNKGAKWLHWQQQQQHTMIVEPKAPSSLSKLPKKSCLWRKLTGIRRPFWRTKTIYFLWNKSRK